MYALYRKGRTHWVGDVQCEVVRVELGDLDHYRSRGWVDDINDINKDTEPKKVVKSKPE